MEQSVVGTDCLPVQRWYLVMIGCLLPGHNLHSTKTFIYGYFPIGRIHGSGKKEVEAGVILLIVISIIPIGEGVLLILRTLGSVWIFWGSVSQNQNTQQEFHYTIRNGRCLGSLCWPSRLRVVIFVGFIDHDHQSWEQGEIFCYASDPHGTPCPVLLVNNKHSSHNLRRECWLRAQASQGWGRVTLPLKPLRPAEILTESQNTFELIVEEEEEHQLQFLLYIHQGGLSFIPLSSLY